MEHVAADGGAGTGAGGGVPDERGGGVGGGRSGRDAARFEPNLELLLNNYMLRLKATQKQQLLI